MDNSEKYKIIYQLVAKAMPQKSKQEQQKEANKLWYKIKHKELTRLALTKFRFSELCPI